MTTLDDTSAATVVRGEPLPVSVAMVAATRARRLGYVRVACCRHCLDGLTRADHFVGTPWIHRPRPWLPGGFPAEVCDPHRLRSLWPITGLHPNHTINPELLAAHNGPPTGQATTATEVTAP
jgi:hypothetical protein